MNERKEFEDMNENNDLMIDSKTGLPFPAPFDGLDYFEDFLREIQTKKYEPIPTGITSIDRLLCGGFERGSLVTLGAAPGAGKTAIAQYILENMAKNGNDVLYINLEMSRSQLLARSIARTAYLNKKNTKFIEDLTALDVKRGYQWTEEQRKQVYYAAALYREKIAPRFVYNPEGVTNEIGSIIEAIKKEAEKTISQGRKAPIVCIDYLQIVENAPDGSGRTKDTAEGIKATLKQLEEMAEKLETVILVIIANNRASNKEGRVTMESGRDTSNIEYAGDLMLGLSYTAVEDKEKMATDETDRNGNTIYKQISVDDIRDMIDNARQRGESTPLQARRLCIKILKSRSTETGGKARFIFDGKHFTFEPDGVKYNSSYGESSEANFDIMNKARKLPLS